MKVSELKKILSEQDNDNEVIFYNLENHNLKEFKLESILEVENVDLSYVSDWFDTKVLVIGLTRKI